MLEYKEVKITRILNPTSIDLGEYVINPFMGCAFACLYCYVRSNKVVGPVPRTGRNVISIRNKPWGEFVEIRINSPDLLEKEILLKKPGTVLLGSTTECFQPIEKKYRIMQRVLEILNKHKVYYVILTRSPLILDYMHLLKEGFCKTVYFSINNFNSEFKLKLESKSPGFGLRDEAVNALLNQGIPIIPYFSPVLPWVSDLKGVFSRFKQAQTIEFECLNFRLHNINDIIRNISEVDSSLKPRYEGLLKHKTFYDQAWCDIKKDIEKQAKEAKKRYNIFVHSFGDYFKNTYRSNNKQG